MKKMINQTARYIIGVFGILLLFLVLCISRGEASVTQKLVSPLFILFFLVTIILLVTYVIHLIWMILEKRKPQNLEFDISFVLISIIFWGIYTAHTNQFSFIGLWQKAVYVILVIVSGEVGQYIYSWKE